MTGLRDISTVLGRLSVQLEGVGPAICFWPSLMMTRSMWAAQAAHFSPRFKVVLIDPPGFGASEPLRAPFTFDQCAQAVVQVLDALGIDRAHFVGNSWGGMIGGTLAAVHPERVLSAVLMNCTASPAGFGQRLEYSFLVNVVRALGRVPAPFVPIALGAFVGPTTRRLRPQVVEAVRASVRAVNGASAHWAIRSVVIDRPDQRALFKRIRAPVQVVAGDEDRTFRVPETKAMADAIPGAQFAVLTGGAHLLGLEMPAEINALIERQLTPPRSPSAGR
jgi:3-oxoadipate enol-lactonase